jgi:hypothetical protein
MVLTASSQNLGGVRFVPVEKLEISWTPLSIRSPKKKNFFFTGALLKNTVDAMISPRPLSSKIYYQDAGRRIEACPSRERRVVPP